MTSVSTHDITFTRAHTATYLTEVILGTIGDILAHLGINAPQFSRDWDTNETAITAWIAEGSLDQVVLECHQPSGTVDPVIEFPVRYTAVGTADAEFTASRARLARFLAKLDQQPGPPVSALTAEPPSAVRQRRSTAVGRDAAPMVPDSSSVVAHFPALARRGASEYQAARCLLWMGEQRGCLAACREPCPLCLRRLPSASTAMLPSRTRLRTIGAYQRWPTAWTYWRLRRDPARKERRT